MNNIFLQKMLCLQCILYSKGKFVKLLFLGWRLEKHTSTTSAWLIIQVFKGAWERSVRPWELRLRLPGCVSCLVLF